MITTAATLDQPRPHSFHIPVMGTGFSIDTPLKVAKYGIDSVVSLVDDVLIEQMRRYHCEQENLSYEEIGGNSPDVRPRRIAAYLDLLDQLVQRDTEALGKQPFEPGSDISRYFEFLPEGPEKALYREMLATEDSSKRASLETELRTHITAGRIDVNIMTKLDGQRGDQPGDAVLALKGFAQSTLSSRLVLSAGLNPRLYSHLSDCDDFYPDESGQAKKQIVLKVSDYRSALVQAKFLARSGIWISEFRVEASINCGGHAFATDGQLLGPILQQFKDGRAALYKAAAPIYKKAMAARAKAQGATDPVVLDPPRHLLTVQGGIGTEAEDRFLTQRYEADGTGWATPFMLVPEVIRVDEAHLNRLAAAGLGDVFLSKASPMGLPFWLLKSCTSEQDRLARMDAGKPGRPCVKGYARNNTEFTDKPLCPSSRTYQKKKLQQLDELGLPAPRADAERDLVLAKVCLCHDLAGSATATLGIEPEAKSAVPCGPNIVNFSRVATLAEMLDHIYGRQSLLTNAQRPHMFIRELELYVDLLQTELDAYIQGRSECNAAEYFERFAANLRGGVDYYTQLAEELPLEERAPFQAALAGQAAKVERVSKQLTEVL